jgi:hypothetical protein
MPPIEPFDQFLARTAAASPDDYADDLRTTAKRCRISPEGAVAEFERMKAHLLRYYEGVRPVYSCLDAAGQVVDCVPFEQQPSVRAAAAAGYPQTLPPKRPRPTSTAPAVASPPDAALPAATPASEPTECRALCPDGTVPLLRLTLERLLRHGTLDNFFRKVPPGTHK